MKNNNLHKNQSYAQALSDDDLENVAGGMSTLLDSPYRFDFSDSEIQKIKEAGYTIHWSEKDDAFIVRDRDFHEVCARHVQEILGSVRYYIDGKLHSPKYFFDPFVQ